MSSIKLLEKNKIALVEEREISFENEKLMYRLYRIDFIEATKYAISANLRNENEICLIEGELTEANVLYEIIVRNAVSPCTLAYVIEDHCKEKY